jgi:hypothetical protein
MFISVTATIVATLLLFTGLSQGYGESPRPSESSQNTLTLGERMYRYGVLPSGEPMLASVKGDLPVSGTAFTCVSCHLRSGLGSIEGGAVTPPTNGPTLFKPAQIIYKDTEQKYFPLPSHRPAYNDSTLAEAIRSGQYPAGKVMNEVMPRYMLEDGDMEILIAYLKSLSNEFSPGVSNTSLHFATIITDDVPPEIRDAMFTPLVHYFDLRNKQTQADQKPLPSRSRLMGRIVLENTLVSKVLANRQLVLSKWLLKGSPDTWRKQLDEYYRKEPVFALLGGITNQDWLVIHQFSEEKKIPCLLPQTDLPSISASDWYTIYPSKGFYQEGESVARYLNGREDLSQERPIVQIVRESLEGKALSEGFSQTWRDLERSPVKTIRLKSGDKITQDFIERLLAEVQPVALLLWDGPDVQATLEFIASAKNKAELVFVSSRYLGKKFRTLPEHAREFTYITYPFSFAQKSISSAMGNISVEDDSKWSISLKDFPEQDHAQNSMFMSNSITQLLTMALLDMKGNYYRDNFFDVISMVPDQPSSIYGRLSFGPGQRYASKGCYIVQVTKGPNPEIVRKSDWVIH